MAARKQRCVPCRHFDQHGWFGSNNDLAHCDECHRSWSSRVEGHCAQCHVQFADDAAFDLHLERSRCIEPGAVRLPNRRRALESTDGPHGVVWRRTAAAERLTGAQKRRP
jgi:hypothetical protein